MKEEDYKTYDLKLAKEIHRMHERAVAPIREEIDVTQKKIVLAVCKEDGMITSSNSSTVGHHASKLGSLVPRRRFAAQSNSPTLHCNFDVQTNGT
ncbi:hypothetical protein BELL_0619g00080 [Botrytis elliptica]|uniref:Uncharacterized protein n=1 Tax=Botrytis elliptica TaxID=278938 RepID=A0A4Z1JBW2_9HELO|nr:hypothetical protein BELL_0619g00080 [Botrytis elliptica]